jgi:hypothetical protein
MNQSRSVFFVVLVSSNKRVPCVFLLFLVAKGVPCFWPGPPVADLDGGWPCGALRTCGPLVVGHIPQLHVTWDTTSHHRFRSLGPHSNALSFLPLPEKTELLVNIRSARDQFICSSNRSFCSPINEASFFAETWLGAVPGAASKPAACCGALLLYSHLS